MFHVHKVGRMTECLENSVTNHHVVEFVRELPYEVSSYELSEVWRCKCESRMSLLDGDRVIRLGKPEQNRTQVTCCVLGV